MQFSFACIVVYRYLCFSQTRTGICPCFPCIFNINTFSDTKLDCSSTEGKSGFLSSNTRKTAVSGTLSTTSPAFASEDRPIPLTPLNDVKTRSRNSNPWSLAQAMNSSFLVFICKEGTWLRGCRLGNRFSKRGHFEFKACIGDETWKPLKTLFPAIAVVKHKALHCKCTQHRKERNERRDPPMEDKSRNYCILGWGGAL